VSRKLAFGKALGRLAEQVKKFNYTFVNKLSTICILCAMLGTIFLFSPVIFSGASVAEAASVSPLNSDSVEVWWPSDGSHLSGLQPFKGLYKNYSLNQYSMYWQVDGGDLAPMYDSQVDYPHKEAQVDVTGWNWRGVGPYVLTFVVKDTSGNIVSAANRTVYIDSSAPASAATPTSGVPPVVFSIIGKNLYVNPNSPAKQQADAWRSSRPSDAALMDKIAGSAQSLWLGNWLTATDTAKLIQGTDAAASAQGSVPVYVLYNIPQRDCGSFSAGGSNNPAGYQAWISQIASAIGSAPAAVVLEPDALAQIGCLSNSDQNTRLSLLADAVSKLKADKNTAVYIDAGHSGWIDADTMAARLKAAGVSQSDGFSLNVSNFQTTSDNASYGTMISGKVGGKHFVIDTSRNGNGSDGAWCNPSGRALGQKPTTTTGQSLIDSYLWVKAPGESDGTCSGGPSAGTWWADYALGLASRASW